MRLIDADALVKSIIQMPSDVLVFDEIRNAPTIQPQIIRCKDCKRWGRLVTFKDGSTMTDCKLGKSIDPEGYCHHAERKEK